MADLYDLLSCDDVETEIPDEVVEQLVSPVMKRNLERLFPTNDHIIMTGSGTSWDPLAGISIPFNGDPNRMGSVQIMTGQPTYEFTVAPNTDRLQPGDRVTLTTGGVRLASSTEHPYGIVMRYDTNRMMADIQVL